MITVKKGQTVDFRSPKTPSYIKETKEIAHELTRDLEREKETACLKKFFLKKQAKTLPQEAVEVRFPMLWNKIRKARNATHQER